MNRTRVYKESYSRRWNSQWSVSVNEVPKFVQNIIRPRSNSFNIGEKNCRTKHSIIYGTPESSVRFAKNGGTVSSALLPESCAMLNARIVYRLRRWRLCTWYACSCPVIEQDPGRTSNCHCSRIIEQAATRQRKVTLSYCSSTGRKIF